LLEDDRPVFEEKTEQRVHVVSRRLGACGLRGDCPAASGEGLAANRRCDAGFSILVASAFRRILNFLS
jgi:hypothetical protein